MSKIVRHSYGLKKFVSDEEYRQMTREANQATADQRNIDESLQRVAVIEAQTARNEFFNMRAVTEGAKKQFMERSGSVLGEAKNSLFKAIICEAFIGALPVDAYYVQEKMDTFTSIMCDYIDEQGGYSVLESAVKAHPEVAVLRRIKNICDTVALESSKRIFRENKENAEQAKIDLFALNEEEKNEFDKKKGELTLEAISKKVHDKVVKVVGDERDRQEKEQALKADLAQATEEGGVLESLRLTGESNVKSSTLYNSLLFSNYKAAIESLSTVKEHYVGEDEESDEYLNSERMLMSTDDVSTPMASDIDLDLIMMESVLQYTILETFHTLALKDYSRTDIQKMSEKLMN